MYDLTEHRHRFAVWAAARAAQRGCKGASVEVLGRALRRSGVAGRARRGVSRPITNATFDQLHQRWCNSIISFLAQKGTRFTYGRAAKLVAVYLKCMVILGSGPDTDLAHVSHPPIDDNLLTNIYGRKKLKWTKLEREAYFGLISCLRARLKPDDPFWKLEQLWTVAT